MAARDVDGEARDEIGVGRGQETDDVGLVGRLGDAAQRRALDLLGLRGLRALVPMRADALGQGDAGGDGVDVDAVGPELEGELAGEGDDAALGRGIGAGAVVAEATAGDRGQVHDLAAALLLHHRNDRVRAEEGGVEVEGDELLPVGEAQLLGRRLRIGDHRAAAHRVDQDVDGAVIARRVGRPAFRPAGDPGHRSARPAPCRPTCRPPRLSDGTASSRWPWLLSATITVAPSLTMILAVARPMPLPPAVISATLFLKRIRSPCARCDGGCW